MRVIGVNSRPNSKPPKVKKSDGLAAIHIKKTLFYGCVCYGG